MKVYIIVSYTDPSSDSEHISHRVIDGVYSSMDKVQEWLHGDDSEQVHEPDEHGIVWSVMAECNAWDVYEIEVDTSIDIVLHSYIAEY